MLRADEVNCRFPERPDTNTKQEGKEDCELLNHTLNRTELRYLNVSLWKVWQWKYDFVNKIGSIVSREMCAVRPIKYSEILELDRKVRDYSTMKTSVLSRPEIPYTAISLQSLLKSVSNEAGASSQDIF